MTAYSAAAATQRGPSGSADRKQMAALMLELVAKPPAVRAEKS